MKAMDGALLELTAKQGGDFRRFEAEAWAQGFTAVAGVDEVGRGPLAGPVVAAAVILPQAFTHPEIKDSKLLSAKQREKLAPIIEQAALSWALGVVDVAAIDRLNILRASLTAMAQALHGLSRQADYVLIDGNQKIPLEVFAELDGNGAKPPQQKTIVQGDRLCLSIAAASIVAKVARDRMMVDFDRQYPDYGFAGHKGYGSAAHLAALRRYGPTPIHRRSFKPVRDLLIAAQEESPERAAPVQRS